MNAGSYGTRRSGLRKMIERETKTVIDKFDEEITITKRVGVWEAYVGSYPTFQDHNRMLEAIEEAQEAAERANTNTWNLAWIFCGMFGISIFLAILALVTK